MIIMVIRNILPEEIVYTTLMVRKRKLIEYILTHSQQLLDDIIEFNKYD